MLHPKNNRIDYGEQLIPPDGYELAHAIGTTYSLDLEALMILPVALFYSQKLDGTTDDLRYDMLDAITKSADKITVYYQNGQLKVPQKYHHLMAYWEKGVQAVTMPDHVSSFHPKVWVIRYEAKELPPTYRVLVTSRNLTFARDWDVAFSTDGNVTDKEQPKNKPLIHFLQYLNTNGEKRIPPHFIKDLLFVKFDMPDKFDELRFVPIGIGNPETLKSYSNPLSNSKDGWDDMLIISPFIDNITLSSMQEATNNYPYLLSRKDELDCINPDILNGFHCWQFSTFFQQAEYIKELEDGGASPHAQNLHAKFYIGMRDQLPYWYLGSANCSDAAQQRNVEFMVELKGKNVSGLKTKDVFKLLTDPLKTDSLPLFTEYDQAARVSTEEKKRIDLAVRKIKFDLIMLEIEGEANQIEGGTAYDISITIDATLLFLPMGFSVAIKPLPENQKAAVKIYPERVNHVDKFGGYAETALSIYLVFVIAKDDQVVSQFLLPMDIELPATRLNKIFTAIINSREKFLKYLTFLLTGEDTDLIRNADKENATSAGPGTANRSFLGTPVYEKLLIASSRFPEKLTSIDALIQRLKEEVTDSEEPIISPEFESFWSVFQKFMENQKA